MIDRFAVPLMTPFEVSTHLQISERTVRYWLSRRAGGGPLVHSVRPERRGWPSIPFVALVEAYVLRALRNLHLSPDKIQKAAAEISRARTTEAQAVTARPGQPRQCVLVRPGR
ncbi:hypothetical protein ABGB07_37800 [Micromonosporaceae bacterium B7E4]